MPRTLDDLGTSTTHLHDGRHAYVQPLEPRHLAGPRFSRIDVAATCAAVGLTWWSFAHLSRQVVVGASPHEMAAQALESTALGVAWLLAVAVVAVMAIMRADTSPTPVALREPAPFPPPPRHPGATGRRRHGSADNDCTSRHATIGCVPVGQYSSSSSRRAA